MSRIFHPRFHFLSCFSADRRFNIGVRFEIDEPMDAVFFGKSGHQTCSVLGDSADQIVGYACLQRPTQTAGEDIDPVRMLAAHREP
jgi:hypothetical protein